MAEAITQCNPEEEINPAFVAVFNLHVYVIESIVVIGLFLDVLTIKILSQKAFKQNFFLALKLLACVDIGYLIVCGIYFSLRDIISYFIRGWEVFTVDDMYNGPWIIAIGTQIYYWLIFSRNWVMVMATTERFISIVAPLWARR